MNTHKTKNVIADGFLANTSPQKRDLINLEYLKEISQGNTEFVYAMLQAFKQESHLFLRDLEKHLSFNDFYSLQKTAHRMKPAGSYIGVDSLTVLVTSLEQAAKKANQKDTLNLMVQVKTMINPILLEIEKHL